MQRKRCSVAFCAVLPKKRCAHSRVDSNLRLPPPVLDTATRIALPSPVRRERLSGGMSRGQAREVPPDPTPNSCERASRVTHSAVPSLVFQTQASRKLPPVTFDRSSKCDGRTSLAIPSDRRRPFSPRTHLQGQIHPQAGPPPFIPWRDRTRDTFALAVPSCRSFGLARSREPVRWLCNQGDLKNEVRRLWP